MQNPIVGLSDAQIADVRQASETLIEDVGFRVGHAGLREMCRAAGAVVEEQSAKVRLPRQLLRELLALVPGEFEIADLRGNVTRIGAGNAPRYHAIVTDPWIVDWRGGRPRPPVLADVVRHTVLAQKLDQVAVISLMDYPVADIPRPDSNLHAMRAHVLHHDKHHLACPASMESFERWLRLGEVLGGGRPVRESRAMSVAVAVISPLILSELNGALLVRACAEGMAVFPTICATAGSTAPYSLLGNVLLGNVETIFLAAMTQLVSPGTPFLYRFAPSVGEMHTLEALYYTLDKIKWNVASAQLGRSYGMPAGSECGGAMTWRTDMQTGAEGMIAMMAAHASGAHFLSGIGSTYNAVGMCGEIMLVQLAWARMATHLAAAMPADDGRLGSDSIRQVGPGGQFLTDDLTLRLMRGAEFFENHLLDYSGSMLDAPGMMERAHERVEELVATPASPLPGDLQENILRFFRDECGLSE